MDQDAHSETRLKAGDLTLDPESRQVTVAGRAAELPPLSYRLLEVLMREAPRVVGHDELIDSVWQKRVVSPETITQRVKLLRQAIGDDAREPTYVGLAWGEGYRMLLPVERRGADEPSFSTSLIGELGRRRVVQVALLYAAVAWSITEVLSFLLDALPVFPAWSKPLVAIVFVVGFPVAMFLAWRFDIGPGGIERTSASTARGRMTIAAAILLMIGATAGLFYLIYPSVSEQAGRYADHPYTQVEFREDAIAVLPFKLASGDPNDRYMSEGLAFELRAQLGRVQGLSVAAETSSTAFRDQNVLAQEISQRLGVGRLIEGSLTRQGELLRISVQIIDGLNGLQTWSKPYEGTVARLMDIQQEIAVDVATQLGSSGDSGAVVPDPLTRSNTAYDLMLRARYLEQEIRDEQVVDMDKQRSVIELYRRATEADPESAIAFSRLASAYLYVGDVVSADAPIFRALTLDPELSDVQFTLAHYYWLTKQELAGEAYREAIRLDPENAEALGAYGHWLLAQARSDLAGDYYRRALSLDRESLERYRDLGGYYGATGRREQALLLAQDIQLRFDDARAYQVLARIYEQTGDVDVAIAWVRKAVRHEPDNPDYKWQLAELYSRIGAPDMANFYQPESGIGKLFWQRRYDELIDVAEEAMFDYPNELPIRYLLAFTYNVTGRFDDSISLLERSGLPGRAYSSSRFAADMEALMTLANAYHEVGRDNEAHDAVKVLLDYIQTTIDGGADQHYWPYMYRACALSVLGQMDEALESIRAIPKTSELVWEPVLRDATCFRPFADHPDYLAVLEEFERRKAELRDRLPETLDRFSEEPQ